MSVNYSSKNRKVTKKSKPTSSIKISTSDNNKNQTEIIIGTLKNNKKKQKNVIDKQNSMKISLTSIPENPVQKQQEITKELQNKLNLLQNSIELERQNCINEINELNEKLKDITQEIFLNKNENENLLNKLKKISDEMDVNIQMKQIYKAKMEELEKNIKNLNNTIEVRKIEISFEEKRKEKFINEIKKLNEMLNLNDEEKLKVLKEEYNKKNEIVENTENEVKNLKIIKNIHKNCDKTLLSLKNKIALLKNDFQFETKKANMLEIQNSPRTNIVSENNVQSKKVNKLRNDNNKNPICLSAIKINHYKQLSKNCHNYVERQFNCLYKNVNINKSVSINLNRETENGNLLFTENEEKILQKLIPNDYLRNLKIKFENLESQKYELMDKFKGNSEVKKSIKNNEMKIDLSRINNETQKKIKISLNANLTKSHKLISELKGKIRKINKEIKIKKAQIKNQEKTYENLQEHLKEFKEKMEKDKIN